MATLIAHSVQVWLTARDARDRARECAKNDPDAWTSDAIVAIVLSAASTEAFINELAELVEMTKVRLDDTVSSELRAFADVIREIEEARGSLLDKYLMAAETLRGSPFDKGTNPYQDFATLVTLRNDIMHLRPRDRTVITPDGRQSLASRKCIAALQQRGLARTPNPKGSMSWFDSIQTTEMASWAHETAHEIILAVLDLIPDDPIPGRDPTSFFKTPFRNRAV